MFNVNLLRKILIIGFFSVFVNSNSYSQETVIASSSIDTDHEQIFQTQLSTEFEMDTLLKENKRCIRCHQKRRLIKDISAISTVGSHTSETFLNNCTACHGIKEKHPKKDNSIISFSEHSSMANFDQNQQCMNCHSIENLRDAEWTHDVHVKPVSCASCHNIHNDIDPMKNIEHTERILMCIDCHGVGN
ncbi:multiheme c-type cytochrome [Vibrio sp. F74]|uniref:multiheme c-type cytochrome n=1 Tax=Vibrio sp. F74 TaxID=700020 RepID=UPI0035F5B273